ncbi:MAG TPA: N-methyl-L-tryptophan oxidase [Phototrophicaceae bacterium]|jgi:monomeric sarcosine oxidase|nr:N-methyl-L-tryptophan oxidase [Phototrophicaceae bacterium]
MTPAYDVIIVGAGAMGSAAAYHLAKSGQRVLLLEQFEINHQYGSSYGASRIIRYSYDDPIYVKLARSTYPLWTELEQESGEKLHIVTGGLDFGPAGDPRLLDTIHTARETEIPHEMITPREAENRFPQYRMGDEFTVMYQPDSGILRASKCVKVHVELAEKHGAVVMDQTPVTGLTIHSDSVEVHTADEIYSAARLIITAGGWAGDILSSIGLNLPLSIMRCHEVYFAPTEKPELYEAERMPVFIFHTSKYGEFRPYGLPSIDGSGVKAGFHGAETFHHPSEIDYTPDTGKLVKQVREYTKSHIPGIAQGKLIQSRVCLYTMTPDEHFIIDTHPAYPHVAIGSPCSGHGFKFSTLIGKILGDLVIHGSTDQDISRFSIARFDNVDN